MFTMQGILLLGRQWLRRRGTQLRLWELWRPRHHSWMQRHLLLQHWLPVDWHHRPRCRQVSTLMLLSFVFQLLFRNIHIQNGHKPRVQSPRDHFWEQRSPMHPLLQVKEKMIRWIPSSSVFLFLSQMTAVINNCTLVRPWCNQPGSKSTVFQWEIDRKFDLLFYERW